LTIEQPTLSLDRGDGTRIVARVREGSGPALIHVPGTWGSAATRGSLMDALDPDLTVVCVALPGQDDNWPPPEDPAVTRFTDDTVRLADELGLERFFISGNSLGGMISVDMLRYGPERILGAIPIEGWTHWTVSPNAFGSDVTSTLTPEQTEFLERVRHDLLYRWDPELARRYSTMWRQWDGWDTLCASDIPVLEIWGDRGRERPSREMMRIPDRPNIELEWIAGASHSLLVEAPERLAELINGFVKRVSESL